MCTAGRQSPFTALMGSASQPSSYASNYGYGKGSSFDPEERQWYIDNGFGDPTQQVASGESVFTGQYRAGRGGARGGTPIRSKVFEPVMYNRGVSPEARYLYQGAAKEAQAIRDASPQVEQTLSGYRAPRQSYLGGGDSVSYSYAGSALGIPAA